MGAVALELRCPHYVNGISVDPQPDWSFDTLLSEINSIEQKLSAYVTFTKAQSRSISALKDDERNAKTFVIHVPDDEMEDLESDNEEEEKEEEKARNQPLVAGSRFSCDDIYMSNDDDSKYEFNLGTQCQLMDKGGLMEGALSELKHEHHLSVMEENRNQILTFENELMKENEKFTSEIARVEKYTETRREMDRKYDLQYQRKVAVGLENHLTAVQSDRESKSQIEERRIKDDAALEEAKRREKALQEEKARQEKLKAEAQARAEAEKKRAEEAKAAAAEADRRAAQEATEKAASRKAATISGVASKETTRQSEVFGADGPAKVQSAGNMLKVAESALRLEERRLYIYEKVAAKNEATGLRSTKDYRSHGMQIGRRIKTITGSKESVSGKAGELIELITSSSWPESISVALFAEKVVSHCVNPTGSFSNAVFAYARVIILVTSKVPLVMDILLAELHRVCIYTVPKHITYSESTFETKEAYYKTIGYREEDGQIEGIDSYVSRLSSYMKLYGALVQTEVEGVQNPHSLAEGWAWLARFLNTLPANLYTAVALQAFLEMAGFALHKKYKTHFQKLLNIVAQDFLAALKERGDPKLNKVVLNIQSYIDSKQFLEEPNGWRLQNSILSHTFVPDADHQEQFHQYHYPPNRPFY